METRTLGSTGLRAGRLGLGLAALGRPGYINLGHGTDLRGDTAPESLEARCHEVLDAAWDAGVRYFDAARSYGRAEEFLGRWLRSRDVGADDAVVGSKWGYVYTADWRSDAEVHEVKEHTLPVLRRQWQESRDRLGDHLDLYQIHSATLQSGVLDDPALLGELARLRETGVAIGLTLSGPGQSDTLRRALEVTVEGEPLFAVVQATWNVLEPAAAGALAEAHARGLGVIVKEALANGRLTARAPADDAARLAPLRRHALRLRASLDALALAAALARSWADVVLSGATTVAQLRANVAALDVPWDQVAEAALAEVVEPAAEYWRRRKELPWT